MMVLFWWCYFCYCESIDGAALCTQNAGGTFPLLLPILGSGSLYTWGQIIIRYSSHTCIAQDLGSSPWLLKRFRAQSCSHCMHELSLYWEQAELSPAHFSLTYSCDIKEINFFKILVKNHTHLSSFIWWFNYLRCQGLNELLKNEVILARTPLLHWNLMAHMHSHSDTLFSCTHKFPKNLFWTGLLVLRLFFVFGGLSHVHFDILSHFLKTWTGMFQHCFTTGRVAQRENELLWLIKKKKEAYHFMSSGTRKT